MKIGISLAALAFLWGCNSDQTQTQTQTAADLEIVEYEDFKIEYDRKNLVANFILKGDEPVTIVSKHSNDGRILTTIEGETIIVLAYGHNEYKSPLQTKMGFGKDSEGNSLISLLPSDY
ncbi:MAG: hypothetical protein LBP54_06290 [Campylobacteraceae bacterium]|jgi:hypothetical protein|nr:hypothetical protein [Campylobacteraceae bacterium]